MNRDQAHFLLLNIGHLLDHLFVLVFATVAALQLSLQWGVDYATLVTYATPGFVAFGVFSLPAGWLADRWSREGMMIVFYFGIGITAILTGFAENPTQVAIGLVAVGMFAAIYHPVGLAIVTAKWKNAGMRIAVNGVWGNLGVASAALLTGFLIDVAGWRAAYWVPGGFSVLVGIAYLVIRRDAIGEKEAAPAKPVSADPSLQGDGAYRALLLRISAIVFVTTAFASMIFQSTTFALPKVFAERMQGLAEQVSGVAEGFGYGDFGIASIIGATTAIVFIVASGAQLVVGRALDKYGARPVFLTVSGMQITFFLLMPGLNDGLALAAAIGFMLGAFGQVPINDFLISRLAAGPNRARIYGVRFVLAFLSMAVALQLVAIVHRNWGFDTLFYLLCGCAAVVFLAVWQLPRKMPQPGA